MENIHIKKELLKMFGNIRIWNTHKSRTVSYKTYFYPTYPYPNHIL